MADMEFRNVWKIYDKKVNAVQDLTFGCKDREFFAILGPSGCGKTSSLRMLAGLEDISRGDILINGQRVNNLSSRERNVAMSFENYGLYPTFNIYDNIAYPLRILKLDQDTINKKVMDIARKLRLIDVLNFKPAALSSGQKQRVSIARALVRNPDVTIMDEPLSHLDAKMRSHMRSVIKRLHNSLGLTTVYVTHDQIEAMTMADKILIMNYGREQQIGTPDEVYSEPANVFVAGFIGTPQMNLFDCEIDSDGYTVKHSQVFAVTAEQYRGQIVAGQKVVLGIRPNNLNISHQPFPGSISGTVYVVEGLGETTIISIRSGDLLLKADVDGLVSDWTYDAPIHYSIDTRKMHLFDAGSGMRIKPRKSQNDK